MSIALKRSLATLVTAVLLCGHALSLLHVAFVAHHLCVEHGALEHGEHTPQTTTPYESGDFPQDQAVSSAPADDEHAHCSVPARLDQKGFSTARWDGLQAPSATDESTLEHTQVIASGSDIVLMAPKQSPPVVACLV